MLWPIGSCRREADGAARWLARRLPITGRPPFCMPERGLHPLQRESFSGVGVATPFDLALVVACTPLKEEYVSCVSVETAEELGALKRVGRLVAKTLRALRKEVRPGVMTAELDERAAEIFQQHGATSAPRSIYDFPGTICISVNEEVVHGVPGPRRLRDGDLVKLDVTPELDGFLADAAITVPVGRPTPKSAKLLRAAEACLQQAIAAAVTGAPLRAIGAATETTARQHGATTFRELCGHGIGRRIHEEPSVPNVDMPGLRRPLNHGLVLAIEPMITMGSPGLVTRPDGWTIATADGSIAAHVEHTVVVCKDRPLVLTA